MKNIHCSNCGSIHADSNHPKTCGACGTIAYDNPLPVAVAIVPISGGGVLAVDRGIRPFGVALPGGFIEGLETWQETASRELLEETGLSVPAAGFSVLAVESTGRGQILIFGSCAPIDRDALASFEPNDETKALIVVDAEDELIFPLHTKSMRAFLSAKTDG